MKHYYQQSLLLIVVIAMAISFLKLNMAKRKIEECSKTNNYLQIDSKNYLESLTSYNVNYSNAKVLSMEGDTIELKDLKKPCLCYFFTPNECETCIDENIFALIKLSRNKKIANIYVITTKERMHYINLMSRAYKTNSLSFGYLLYPLNLSRSNYFIVFEDGRLLNSYYPRKGEFVSTQKYLKKTVEVINNTNNTSK
jgi:hypothetical protein